MQQFLVLYLKCMFTYGQGHRVKKQKRGKLFCSTHGNTLISETQTNLKTNIGVAQSLPPSERSGWIEPRATCREKEEPHTLRVLTCSSFTMGVLGRTKKGHLKSSPGVILIQWTWELNIFNNSSKWLCISWKWHPVTRYSIASCQLQHPYWSLSKGSIYCVITPPLEWLHCFVWTVMLLLQVTCWFGTSRIPFYRWEA